MLMRFKSFFSVFVGFFFWRIEVGLGFFVGYLVGLLKAFFCFFRVLTGYIKEIVLFVWFLGIFSVSFWGSGRFVGLLCFFSWVCLFFSFFLGRGISVKAFCFCV